MPAGAVGNPPWATGSWSATAWEAGTWGDVDLTFVLDLNTRLHTYLTAVYVLDPSADLTAMTARFLRGEVGDYTARFQKLIDDATDSMT